MSSPDAERPGGQTMGQRPARVGPHRLRRAVLPVTVTVLGLLVTAMVVVLVTGQQQDNREKAFTRQVTEARAAVAARIEASTNALYGLRGWFASAQQRNQAAFRHYADQTREAVPGSGVQAVSFNRAVAVDDLPRYEANVRADTSLGPAARSGFQVHPEPDGDRDPLYVVELIEPVAGNEAALGFDVGSNPARRAAIEATRDSGYPSATSPIRLVQEQGESQGLLLFLGVYDRDQVPVTAPARRRAFVGVVTTVLRLDDLLAQVMGERSHLNIEVYDVGPTIAPLPTDVAPANLVYDSDAARTVIGGGGLSRTADLNVADRRWRMFVAPAGPVTTGSTAALPITVAAAGAILSLLAGALIHSLTRSRRLALSMATDMTRQLRDREQDLAQANVSLEASNEHLSTLNNTMSEFVSIASHELRSPLASVLGFTRVLQEAGPDLPATERANYLAIIERNGQDMEHLVNDLLTVSRIESGALRTHVRPTHLGDALGATLDAMGLRSSVQLSIDPELVVTADPEHLRRMVTNYVRNAFTYGAAPIEISAHATEATVDIAVTDHGEGVPAAFAPELFMKFARAGTRGLDNARSSGLGLWIVRELARGNHGDAWYEPAQPRGSRFLLRLPRATPEPGETGDRSR